MLGEVVDSLLTVQAAVLPGTDTRLLAGRLADAVASLPVTAAAGVGPVDVPTDIVDHARQFGERQGMAEAAADVAIYVLRLWHRPDERVFPADRYELAARLRTHFEQRVCGVHSGMTSLTVFPASLLIDNEGWLTMARRCPWWAVTTDAPDGLIPTD